MQTLVRLEGSVERILERLVKEKYYSNKSEAIRAGILELGQKWSVSPREETELVVNRIRKMEEEVKAGKRKVVPLREVAREAGVRV